eukprot:m.307092 g.307092  ORF g.307092 m.307092 type:complete len:320 (-) comp55311_c0_seq6:83-1042(-)
MLDMPRVLVDNCAADVCVCAVESRMARDTSQSIRTDDIPFFHIMIDKQFIFPPFITQARMDQAKTFPVRPTDVFITTFPKSGTTWTQRVVQLIQCQGDVSKDSRRVSDAIPWFEAEPQDEMGSRPDPRIYKSHSQWEVIARNDAAPCKYLYVARNPKDTCVSLFHHMKAIKAFTYEADWDEFFELFMARKVESGCWFGHVKSYWERRNDPNVLFLKFEEMKVDLKASIRRIAQFIGAGELTDDVVDKIAELTSFESMKEDVAANYVFKQAGRKEGAPAFMRKGTVGDWTNYFTEDQSRRMDEVYEQELGDSGLVFDYSL